ncbi:MAG: trypsin-like peptidase domain-containing protein [Lapillicoccus sp.]
MTQQTHPFETTPDKAHDGPMGGDEDRSAPHHEAPHHEAPQYEAPQYEAQQYEAPLQEAAAPVWFGEPATTPAPPSSSPAPAPWRGPSADYDPFRESSAPATRQGVGYDDPAASHGTATVPPPAPTQGGVNPAATAEVPTTWDPQSPAYPTGSSFGGDGGWGGPHEMAPMTPPPAPPARRGRRIVELSAVAILAAALASGGTFAATHYGSTTTAANGAGGSSGSSPSGSSVPAPIHQVSANAPDWAATAKAVTPSVVAIKVASQSAEGQGSGVVIDAQGRILTNNHVATGAGAGATITVTLNDGRSYDATIVGTDATTDLAVLALKNPPSDLTPISFGDSDQLTVGQPVMAVGNPLGLAGTVTTGIVSALNRPVTTSSSEAGQQGQGQSPFGGQNQDTTNTDVTTNAIQTSAAINPGNSGGALVTADGQLIGINSSIASLGSSSSSSQSGNIGIGFAIPVKEAKSIADQLIKTGTAQHAYLGVSSIDTTVTDSGSKRAAAMIRSVSAGTPAATAGLKANDAVVAINGAPIESSESLVATVHEFSVGNTVTVTVIRSGARQDIKVTLAARPGQG